MSHTPRKPTEKCMDINETERNFKLFQFNKLLCLNTRKRRVIDVLFCILNRRLPHYCWRSKAKLRVKLYPPLVDNEGTIFPNVQQLFIFLLRYKFKRLHHKYSRQPLKKYVPIIIKEYFTNTLCLTWNNNVNCNYNAELVFRTLEITLE